MDIQPLSARTGETVVLETDFCCDVDDVAALSLLCGEERRHPGACRRAITPGRGLPSFQEQGPAPHPPSR